MDIQRDLYPLMAEIAATPENAERFRPFDSSGHRPYLAARPMAGTQADSLSTTVTLPAEFILPGDSLSGCSPGSRATIVRRAERRVAELLDTVKSRNPVLLQYLNRLSSLCFALELLENQSAVTVPPWRRNDWTLLNIATVLVGGTLGLLFGARLPDACGRPSSPRWDCSH